jgi:DNA-binding SARP family transcriptional activator
LTRLTVEGVISVYQGRFALDFPYEDWATNYRDHLHARFLAEVERGVAGQLPGADDRWRLWIGQQALLADPEADDIEAHVIGLYRRLGAHAAAAEQYAHYASTLRDQLGVEPPAFGDL